MSEQPTVFIVYTGLNSELVLRQIVTDYRVTKKKQKQGFTKRIDWARLSYSHSL